MKRHTEYTNGQLSFLEEQIEDEMKKFKLPYLTRKYKFYIYPLLEKTIMPFFILLLLLFSFYINMNDEYIWIWKMCQFITYAYILFFAIFGVISHITEIVYTTRFRRKLKLSKRDFLIYCVAFDITGL
jgi:hypothetical protein